MLRIHSASNRGRTRLDWLDSWHSFSFGDYYDVKRMGFHSLRVINEDRVEPNRGFETHPHRDMEIVTFVISGTLEHQDSLGTLQEIRSGEVQHMTAGQGVLHSERNPSLTEPVHFLQIWILPSKKGLKPEYQKVKRQKTAEEKDWQHLLSGTKVNGALKINQDIEIWEIRSAAETKAIYAFQAGRAGWVQVVSGRAQLPDGREVQAGDGIEIEDENQVQLASLDSTAEFLLFDLKVESVAS